MGRGEPGARVDDLSLRVAGAAVLAAVSVALDAWQRDGGKTDLLTLVDQGDRRFRRIRTRALGQTRGPRALAC